MAVEWEAEKKSESGSSVSSDLSSEDLNNGSDNADSDYSDNLESPVTSPGVQKIEKRVSRCSTGGDLASICEEGGGNVTNGPVNNGPAMAIDLSACMDFVASLGEQVQAMQDKIQKSKECLLDESDEDDKQSGNVIIDGKLGVNGNVTKNVLDNSSNSNGTPYPYMSEQNMPTVLPEPTPAEFEDDGCYETPLQVDALRQRFEHQAAINGPLNGPLTASLHGPIITQDQEYEEVLRVPHRQPSQHEAHEKNDENYMTVSNYENHVNHDTQVHHVQMRAKSKKKSQNSKGHEDGAIYEFPPDDGEEDSTELDIDEQRKLSLKAEEEVVTKPADEIVYKYDGPLIFGVEDTSEIVRIEERDAVRKWDPVSSLHCLLFID